MGSEMKAAYDSSKEKKDMPETGDSKIADLRNSIADLINEILKEDNNDKHKGFLFFIDDLDRIEMNAKDILRKIEALRPKDPSEDINLE